MVREEIFTKRNFDAQNANTIILRRLKKVLKFDLFYIE